MQYTNKTVSEDKGCTNDVGALEDFIIMSIFFYNLLLVITSSVKLDRFLCLEGSRQQRFIQTLNVDS